MRFHMVSLSLQKKSSLFVKIMRLYETGNFHYIVIHLHNCLDIICTDCTRTRPCITAGYRIWTCLIYRVRLSEYGEVIMIHYICNAYTIFVKFNNAYNVIVICYSLKYARELTTSSLREPVLNAVKNDPSFIRQMDSRLRERGTSNHNND